MDAMRNEIATRFRAHNIFGGLRRSLTRIRIASYPFLLGIVVSLRPRERPEKHKDQADGPN
jgi:hypothetical protein